MTCCCPWLRVKRNARGGGHTKNKMAGDVNGGYQSSVKQQTEGHKGNRDVTKGHKGTRDVTEGHKGTRDVTCEFVPPSIADTWSCGSCEVVENIHCEDDKPCDVVTKDVDVPKSQGYDGVGADGLLENKYVVCLLYTSPSPRDS